jgi:HEAT repeat protein
VGQEEVESEFARNPEAAREAALGSSDPEVRRRAILHFGWQGNQEALHVLAQVARDRDPEIRGKAVDALESFVDQPAMLRSTLEVLGRLVGQHPRVREVLTHVMKTAEQADIRRLAADSLRIPLDDTTNAPVSRGPGTDAAR